MYPEVLYLANIIVTPHLGALTAEAQVTATKDVVVQIIDVFNGCSPLLCRERTAYFSRDAKHSGPFGQVAIYPRQNG